MQPDYDDLFVMSDPGASRPLWLTSSKDPRFWVESFYELVVGLYRGEAVSGIPIQLHHFRGGEPTDVMWSDYPPIVVISQRVIDLLTGEGLSGWGTYSVDVHDKQGEILPAYRGLVILGRAGMDDLERGTLISKPPKVEGGTPYEVLRGTYFKDDYWDGSDFCIMGKGGYPVVTRRVVNTFKRAGIRNVKFVPLRDEETDIGLYQTMGLWSPKS